MPNTQSTNEAGVTPASKARATVASKAAGAAAAKAATHASLAAIEAAIDSTGIQDEQMEIPAGALEDLDQGALENLDEYEDEKVEEFDPSEPIRSEKLVQASAPVPAGDELVEGWDYDPKTDDYTKVTKPASEWLSVSSSEVARDGFDISERYHQGDGADFDYRWIPKNQKYALEDRTNGFVPVKKLLDARYRIENGVVSNGDLVLARRPKSATERRAREQATIAGRLSGETDRYRDAIEAQGSGALGEIEIGSERVGTERRATPDPVQMHEILEQGRTGRKSYVINAPFQRDLLAERAARERKAVGG